MTISVAVAGATGYAGAEILRLLCGHPAYRSGELRIGSLMGNSSAGQPAAELLPHLPELAGTLIEPTDPEVLARHDVVFLALPHGHSAAIAAQLPADVAVIDCAADFRLRDAAAWERYYGSPHAGTWPYGIPEMPGHRAQISASKRVAVPGCFPTGATLAAYPALYAGLIKPDVRVVSISGVSGAGKKASVAMLGAETMGSLKAYNTAGKHRHTPEIAQNLAEAAEGGENAGPVTVSFTPVLAPLPRGILTTVTAPLAPGANEAALKRAYEDFYRDEAFVWVLPDGSQPQTQNVVGSNMCHVQAEVDPDAGVAVLTSAIDNLTKGTGGAAVQCMNLVVGFSEGAGLPRAAVAP